MKLLITLSLSFILLSCTTYTPERVREWPSGYICEALTNHITTAEDRRNLYAELERRGQQCI